MAAGAVALVAAACIGEPPEVTVDDPELQEGRNIYGSACAACHGADGGGGSGPKLSDGAVTAAYPDIADQIELVTNGRGQMPAYVGRLSDEQIRAVVRYTREIL
ncbi:MAG: cytochrome c [Actinomycetota bacterium]